jgi:outer membrane protein assembly factor BamE (lipoprotein component of BamABCDE complex)
MKRAILAFALLSAAGCASYDGYNLKPGTSTEDEVRRTMGAPALEFQNPDGSRELAYPRGPMGLQTFMVEVAPDRRLVAVRQVLSDDVFRRIHPGMTRDQVLRLIGPPGDRMDFARTQQESWEWRYQDTWRYIAIFSVNFDRQGVVVSKFSRRLERNDGGQK